jgi:hypothetical protein
MKKTKVVEKLEIRIISNNVFLKNHTVYEIMWKNIVEQGRPQMTVWCMHNAY